MVKWEIPKQSAPKPVRAVKCKFNPGVIGSDGKQVISPARIWVDDALMAAVGIFAKAIFVVMGEPNEKMRQCPLAMDKWEILVVAEHQLALGLILNTRRLSVAITAGYLAETLQLIRKSWHSERKRFTAIDVSRLVGKLGRLAEAAPWSRHLVSHFYSSIAHALSQNEHFLKSSSPKFQQLIKNAKGKSGRFH